MPKDVNIPEPSYHKDKFGYNAEEDAYVCPVGTRLTFRGIAEHHGRMMRLYKSGDCMGCNAKGKCTRNSKGRIIYRWEHEEILEDMRHRVKANKEKVKMRQWLSEHPFGTIKRSFNQGYMMLKRLEKVGAEMSLSVLTYNIKRVINVLGLNELIGAVRQIP